MADVVFNSFKKEIMDTFDLDTDDIRVQLIDGYIPDQDNDTRMSDVTGLVESGVKLINVSITQDNTDNEGVFDADDVIFTNSTMNASGCIIYHQQDGSAANQNLIAFFDFGTGQSSSAGSFTIQWAAEGILNFN